MRHYSDINVYKGIDVMMLDSDIIHHTSMYIQSNDITHRSILISIKVKKIDMMLLMSEVMGG